LLGAGTAFVWRPWRWAHAPDAPAGRILDPVGAAAVAMLGCAASVAVLTEGYVYQWLLPLVSILSLVAVMVAVHPAARGFRRIMSWTPLVEMGRRSYGLYLWSWPIFVIVGATAGSVARFLWAMVLTVIVAEASYRCLETPVRQGAIGRWWGNRATITYWPMAGGAALVGVLLLFYATVGEFNRFEGGDDAVFDLEAVGNDGPVTEGSVPAASIPATAPTTPIVPASSARLAIVGDSQANALAINLPDAIEGVFPEVVNGSVDGCSVHDSGSVRSSVSFGNNFSTCRGWQQEWADAAAGNDVALVVVGAWDVFDIEAEGTVYGFASPRGDALFVRNLRSGVDAMLAEGANVALLEVACMRPRDVEGAGVRALPERGDDARVAHVNDLLRETAASYDSPRVEFVESPRRMVLRRGDRHRPRIPLGRRPRLQTGRQSDLQDHRPPPAAPRNRLTGSAAVGRARTGVAHIDQLAAEEERRLLRRGARGAGAGGVARCHDQRQCEQSHDDVTGRT
jgi:hypothetical protein